MLRTPPSSASAVSASSADIAFPCQPSWSSIFEKPLPLIVFATTTVGFPLVPSASS